MTKALPLLLIASTLLAGCGSAAEQAGLVPTESPAVQTAQTLPESASTEGETSSGHAASASTRETAAEPAEPAEPVVCKRETGGQNGVFTNLRDVRVGAHEGYDRIVFEFAPPEPNPGGQDGIPYYEIRQAKAPFTQDPSDLPLDVAGDSFVHIVMQGSSGYDFDGNPTYTGPRVLTPGFGTLAQAVQGGDFEATLTWILGLSRPTCWQVQELHDPDRLVIDFHHV